MILLLPNVRNAFPIFDIIFISDRYIAIPSPVFAEGAWIAGIALIAAIVGIFAMSRWAHKRQDQTGEQFPVFWLPSGFSSVCRS